MSTGAALLHGLRNWGRAVRFAGMATAAALSPSTYGGAGRAVAVRQIYFTAWQILPGYVFFTAALGFILIEITAAATRRFGLPQHALELVLRVLVLEIVPLLTALVVALRSGAAIATEVAFMHVSGELARLEADGGDPLRGEFAPRVAAVALSLLSLTVISCAIVIVLSYPVMYGASPWAFGEFTRIVGKVFGPVTLAGLALKCVLFGLAVAVIPIAAALRAVPERIKSAPVAVMGGMVRLFFVLGVIEVVALLAKYL